MNNEFISKVFRWFGLGLLVTFLVAYVVSVNDNLLSIVFGGYGFIIIFILEMVCAIWLTARIRNMSSGMAKGLYIGYSALTGLTLSSIFIVYELTSIIWIFLVTSIVFFCFSIIGKNMNVDLRKLGIYLFVFLIGLIILEIVNMFIMNNTLNMITCILGLGIFVGYVAYDIRKLDYYEDNDNMAVIGAFELYLDFINLFIRLLELFGRNRD